MGFHPNRKVNNNKKENFSILTIYIYKFYLYTINNIFVLIYLNTKITKFI